MSQTRNVVGRQRQSSRPQGDRLLISSEVAEMFRVDVKTVNRWVKLGKIPHIRTPGGHSRFRESEVLAILSGENGDV